MHAYPNGHAPGAARLRALATAVQAGAGAGSSQDVALLIAAEKGARLIVSVALGSTCVAFLDRSRKAISSTFLTRLRVGDILVDAKAVSRIYGSAAP